MKSLKEELDLAKDTLYCENPRAIFKIESYYELIQIIEKLKSIDRCSNYEAWIANNEAEKYFNRKISDYVSLSLKSYELTYSLVRKFDDFACTTSTYHDIVIIDTIKYIDKMARKKLIL